MPDPNKIEGGRWDRVLRSKFNLKGAGSTSARISDDISPTFSFPYRIEDDFLIGDRLLVGRMSSGAVAAQNPRCILTNGSDNKLLILERIQFAFGAGGSPYFGTSSAVQPFIADVPVFLRDGRWGPLQGDVGSGASRLQEATLVGAPTPIIQTFFTSDSFQVYEPQVVLEPNDHAFLTNATVNTLINATFYWREHLMEPSEVA